MALLLDKTGKPLDDVVVLDQKDLPSVLPQSEAVISSIRSWLNPTQYQDDGSEYRKHLASHLKGTGQWAIESPIFQEWRDGKDHGILWIRGIPGAGKSVHAANLIQHLCQDDCPVLYFFFRHTIQANHRPEAALRDWLAQALPFSPPLQLELKGRVSSPVDQLTIFELGQLVRLALKHVPKAYCVVDALDEMDQAALEPFLQMLDELGQWRPGEVKLIITSRPVAVVERVVRNLRLLDVRLDKELVEPDIKVYLQHRLAQSCVLPDSHSSVANYIIGKADGLFLYAKLAMDAISHLEDDLEVQQALHDLPTDLTDVYSNLLREHLQRTKISPELQMLILQCVTHAVRPLRLLEISDCIVVTQPQHGNDPGELKGLVRSACGPLLEVLPDETVRVVHHSLTEYLLGIIRPSQNTVSPFMMIDSGQTHACIAMLCLKYLKVCGLAQIKVKEATFASFGPEQVEKGIYTPFTNYAVLNWHAHIKKAAACNHDMRELHEYLHELLVQDQKDNTKKLGVFAKLGSTGGRASGREPKAQASALRLAIALELSFFADNLLDRYGNEITNYDPDIDYSPLIFAVKHGNYDVVQSLIHHGVDVNEYDSHGSTALHTAVGNYHTRNGNPKMAEILLKAGADPEKDRGEDKHVFDITVGGRDRTPACMNAFNGRDARMAAVFMPYVKGAEGANRALHWAVSGSRNLGVIAEVLRHPDLDINAQYGYGKMTPLYMACAARDPALIRELLAAGANPNVLHRDHYGQREADQEFGYNALHALASRGGDFYHTTANNNEVSEEETTECFNLVIAAGANLQQTDRKQKMTPLHEARDKIAARCLIEAGADVNAENSAGETPIHLLSDGDVLEALLDVFDINTQTSRSKQTLLIRALDGKNSFLRSTVKAMQEFDKALRLIDLGADVTVVDNMGRSALHYATQLEDVEVPKLRLLWQKLIDAGADPNLQDKDGETPLHELGSQNYKSKYTKECYVEFLAITKCDLEIEDKEGRSPLFKIMDTWSYPSPDEVVTILNLFAQAGARFDVTDLRQRTLLHAAAPHCRGDTKHIQFLVDQGVDPNQQDIDGNTIWHEAIPKFCSWRVSPHVFRAFTAIGADLSATNKRGRAPIHVLCEHTQWAAEEGNWEKQDDPTVLEYVLNYNEDQANVRDDQGVAPLHIASTFSPFIVQELLKGGASIGATTDEGLTAFHLAARSRQANVLGVLISWLTSQGDQSLLKSLIELKDILNRTPLYYACASGRIESVQLLINAGASVDTDTYVGSAWNGCADFEEEQRSAEWSRRSGTYGPPGDAPPAGGTLISDKLRPKSRARRAQVAISMEFPMERIDEIVDLLIMHGAASGRKFLDEAISQTIEQQFDYTAMCLFRARESLAITTALHWEDRISECVSRRNTACSVPFFGNSPSLYHLMQRRCFDAAIKLLLDDPEQHLLNETRGFAKWSTLDTLVYSGFSSMVDTLLTPEIMEKLRTVPAPENPHRLGQYNIGDHEDDTPHKQTQTHEEKKTYISSDSNLAKLLKAACLAEDPNMDMLRVLIEKKGVHVDSVVGVPQINSSHKGNTALLALALLTRLDWWHLHQALPYLLSQHADTEARNSEGETALQLCLRKVGKPYFSMKMAKTLLGAGADPNAVDDRDQSCLALAVGDKAVFEMLLDHGAKVTHSALIAAISSKDVELLQLALSRDDVDPNIRKVGKEVARQMSADGRSWISERHDPNGRNELYPIDYLMCVSGREDKSDASIRMFDLLLKHGADLSAKYELTTVAHRLISNKGDSNNTTYGGENAFLERALEHPGLDVEVRNGHGRTLLLHACRLGKMAVINALLDRGADIRARDKTNCSALALFLCSSLPRTSSIFGSSECAPPNELLDLRSALIQRMVSVAPALLVEVDDEGRTPLLCALENGNFIASDVEALLEAGADISAANSRTGDSPLHLLLGGSFSINVNESGTANVTGKRKDLIYRFLALGADINASNNASETPIFNYFHRGTVTATVLVSEEDEAVVQKLPASEQYNRRIYLRNIRESKAAVDKEHMLFAIFEEMGVRWSTTSKSRRTLLHVVAGAGTDDYTYDQHNKRYIGRRQARFRFLMSKGLDVLAEDDRHQTALDVAAALGAEEILDIFKSKD